MLSKMSELTKIYDAIIQNRDLAIFSDISDDILSQQLDIFEGRSVFDLMFDVERDEGKDKRFAKTMTEQDVLALKAAKILVIIQTGLRGFSPIGDVKKKPE